ncbi:MAG: hypothetical protein EOO61_07040, partial [Hymenobacter sp.]
MQKSLNTHTPMYYPLLQRLLLNSKKGMLACLTLLMLAGFTTSAKAGDFGTNFVITNGTPNSTNDNPGSFQGKNLGTFNRTSTSIDVLALSAEANIVTNTGDNVQSTQLLYRIYRDDNLGDLGDFIPLPLQQTSENGNNLKWTNTGSQPNLINSTTTPGTYTLQLYFQTSITNNGITSIVRDNNSGKLYAANFTVTVNGDLYVRSSWDNSKSPSATEWFDKANWSSGEVPNSNTDVTIPYIPGIQYPIISGGGQAQVHSLRIQGVAGTQRARLNVAATPLLIYGDFQDTYSGLINSNSILAFVGRDQIIDASETIYDVIIDGGGTKSLTGQLNIQHRLTFGGNGGLLVTRTENAEFYRVNLQSTARVENESEIGYVLGTLRS